MGSVHGEEPVLHVRGKRKSFIQSIVAWRLKAVVVLIATLGALPLGRAGGGHADNTDETGSTICLREEGPCFDKKEALKLKLIAIAVIFLSSLAGVSLPLLGRKWSFMAPNSRTLFVAKAFGGGVVLATGFIHIFPEAISRLESECLPEHPWHSFPFATFFAMLTTLMMVMIEFLAIGYYEGRAKRRSNTAKVAGSDSSDGSAPRRPTPAGEKSTDSVSSMASTAIELADWQVMAGHVHSIPMETEDEGLQKIRNVVVAQVLEFGIASHSILIGLAMGVSFAPCDIRPLLGALTFHQFFEGVALGGCISQAGFRNVSSTVMALVFATTTPLGICLGLAISSSYNEQSVTALLTEGILDSVSAGILMYMALVNLIANEFFSRRLRKDTRLQIFSFISLFLGAATLSIIGIWA